MYPYSGEGGFKTFALGVLIAILVGILMMVCFRNIERLEACHSQARQAEAQAASLAQENQALRQRVEQLEAAMRGSGQKPGGAGNGRLALIARPFLAQVGTYLEDPILLGVVFLCLVDAGLGLLLGWLLGRRSPPDGIG